MTKKNKILVINLGSTSTKVAVFEYEKKLFEKSIEHSADEIARYKEADQQMDMRKQAIMDFLAENSVELSDLAAVAARGGLFGHVQSGAYVVDERLVAACKNPLIPHPTNLSAIIGYEIAKPLGINAYIYDAPCTDETDEVANVTGIPEIKRDTFTHVLNSRAAAIRVAEEADGNFSEMTFVVTHLGGGISSNIIKNGKMIDTIPDDQGTFSPERAGKLPCVALVKMCYESGLDQKTMQRKLRGQGGLVAYLGTNSAKEVEEMVRNGDEYANLVYRAMALQIAKDIGVLSVVASGKIDYIILTGGIAKSEMLTGWVKEKVEFIAPVKIVPGTYEMEALAGGITRVLNGQEEAKVYVE